MKKVRKIASVKKRVVFGFLMTNKGHKLMRQAIQSPDTHLDHNLALCHTSFEGLMGLWKPLMKSLLWVTLSLYFLSAHLQKHLWFLCSSVNASSPLIKVTFIFLSSLLHFGTFMFMSHLHIILLLIGPNITSDILSQNIYWK